MNNIIEEKKSKSSQLKGDKQSRSGVDSRIEPPIFDRNMFLQKLDNKAKSKGSKNEGKNKPRSFSSSNSSADKSDSLIEPPPKNESVKVPPITGNGTCDCVATVLVVEDNFYNVIPLKMLLRTTYNIQIERAENGKIGVEAYEANATKKCCKTYFKLIFMDIQMPVMNGYESAKGIL